MTQAPLIQKKVLITGGARRIGRAFALASADAGADVIIHYGHAREQAEETQRLVMERGRQAWTLEADFTDPGAVQRLADAAFSLGAVYALVNNAAIFGPAGFREATLQDWEGHMSINLTAPFLLSQAFGRAATGRPGRIINVLDWRVARPGPDHFSYTVSKAALTAMTKSLAQAMAPHVSVNGLALGAILPPEDNPPDEGIIRKTPARRWGTPEEAAQALVFLLTNPGYITGEVVYLDGGRHLI